MSTRETESRSETLHELLARRFSCRSFLPEPLDEALLREIVAEAALAPSWSNTQPWEVIVTRGAETDRLRAALLEAAGSGSDMGSDFPFPHGYSEAQKARRREVGWQLYDAVGVKKGDRVASAKQAMENFRLFGAPHAVILTAPESFGAYGALDCGAFLMALCLAAEARGVATCAQGAVAGFSPLIRRHFAIAEERAVLCGIAMGRPDRAHPANAFRAGRAPLDEILTMKG